MNQESGEKSSRADAPRRPAPAAARVAERSLIRMLWTGFAAALRLGPGENQGPSRQDVGTHLAAERSYMAAERTLMAWIRTALSMISFGFTIGKLGQTVTEVQVKGVGLRAGRMVSVEGVAYFLVIVGTLALLGAILQYLVSIAEYATMGLRRRVSISFFVALVLVLLGGFAFTSLVMRL